MDTYFYDIWSYFGPRSKLVNPKLKICTFCWLSWNINFKVDLDTHLTDKHGHLFLWYLELFWPPFIIGKTKVKNMHFCQLSQNWNFKVDLEIDLRDKHGHLFYDIWSYFGPCLRLVNPSLKTCTFVDFLIIEFWKQI